MIRTREQARADAEAEAQEFSELIESSQSDTSGIPSPATIDVSEVILAPNIFDFEPKTEPTAEAFPGGGGGGCPETITVVFSGVTVCCMPVGGFGHKPTGGVDGAYLEDSTGDCEWGFTGIGSTSALIYLNPDCTDVSGNFDIDDTIVITNPGGGSTWTISWKWTIAGFDFYVFVGSASGLVIGNTLFGCGGAFGGTATIIP